MSGLRITTGPATEPVVLAEARDHCRIDSSDEDGLLAGYIIAAREHCERETGRLFMTQSLQLTFDGDWPACMRTGDAMILLPMPPAVSVASIQYVDTAGTTQTLAADQYRFTQGDLFGAIKPAYGVTWPTVRSQDDAITVAFTAGYGSNPGDVPAAIRQAILLLVAHWFNNREAVAIGQFTELPLAVASLLNGYRTYW